MAPGSASFPVAFQKHQIRAAERTQAFTTSGKNGSGSRPLLSTTASWSSLLGICAFSPSRSPFFVEGIERVDGFLQVGLPGIYITDFIFIAAVTYLLVRRVIIPQMRYISLPADYFPLLLLLAIGRHRHSYALFHQGGPAQSQNSWPWGLFPSIPVVPAGHRGDLLHSPFPGEHPVCLLSVQQAHARGRGLPEPDPEPSKRQPDQCGTSTRGTTR